MNELLTSILDRQVVLTPDGKEVFSGVSYPAGCSRAATFNCLASTARIPALKHRAFKHDVSGSG